MIRIFIEINSENIRLSIYTNVVRKVLFGFIIVQIISLWFQILFGFFHGCREGCIRIRECKMHLMFDI